MLAEALLQQQPGLYAEHDVGGQRRLAGQQVGEQAAPQDLLVHRVRLDVLVVEALTGRAAGQPREGGGQPLRAWRAGDLDHRELADGDTPQRPVQPAERHQVDRRQGHRRGGIDIATVHRLEVQLAHHVGEQLGVHPLATPRAVLVVLHADIRRLGLALQPGHHERLRVALHQVVHRPVGDVLAQLIAGAVP